jgi:hypothetical protein
MSALGMLNVAIGIIFVFLLLSLICTAISEMIEAWLKRRATDLERGITELLRGAKNANGEYLVKKIYEHPLIAGLYRGDYIPKGRKLPSYIPASNFTLALLDAVLPATNQNLSGSAGGGSPEAPVSSDILLSAEEGKLPNEDAPAMGSQAVKPDQANRQINLKSIREAILKLPPSLPKDGILTLIDAAGGDINKLRQNVENWYNTAMDRVSGWYKRRIQKVLFLIGFLLAIAVNADTIAILKALTGDPVLQESMVVAATSYTSDTTDTTTGTPKERVQKNIQKLNELRLPIGWDWGEQDNAKDSTVTNNLVQEIKSFHMPNYYLAIPNTSWGWLLKVIGWLITGLAVSLGAPFWFDALNRVMVIRSTVKPHEKSPEEPSEDQKKKKKS